MTRHLAPRLHIQQLCNKKVQVLKSKPARAKLNLQILLTVLFMYDQQSFTLPNKGAFIHKKVVYMQSLERS